MTHSFQPDAELLSLINSACSDTITAEQIEQLEKMLRTNQEACRLYLRYLTLESEMHFLGKVTRADRSAQERVANATVAGLFGGTWQATVGYLSSGWPVAYLIATLIFGLGLLIGSHVYVSRPVRLARQPSAPGCVDAESKRETIGRITGMVDCRWAATAFDSPAVPLGRKYELASGLMEITYDTGAKVILQGPVKYEVESAAGGYLAVGKLTGKVTTEAARGLTIRTPTATVTDLGTEFGVEVDKQGSTVSHVFRGSVRLESVSTTGKPQGIAHVLHENESAQVAGRGKDRRLVLVSSAKPVNFVRQIPRFTTKTLDLVDVVAGGDGFSGRRGHGIDATNGKPTDALPPKGDIYFTLKGDGKYRRVDRLPFVDGVFIPDGRAGQVQIDSTGRTFDGFPDTSNTTSGYLWAGGVVPACPGNNNLKLFPVTLGGIDYASPGHGVLFLHANKGITFDLAAIRQANPGCKLVRFQAAVGNTETARRDQIAFVRADFWVLVDAQMRYRRQGIDSSHGAYSVVVPLAENDRFLTLAATDGGDGIGFDWIVFGDPRIEMGTNEPTTDKGGGRH